MSRGCEYKQTCCFNKSMVLVIVLLNICLIVTGCAWVGLPSADNLDDLRFVQATQVFDINGQLISKLFEENRIVVPRIESIRSGTRIPHILSGFHG